MKNIYFGMGCFWSSQYLIKKYFPNLETTVGYMDNIEVLKIDYETNDDLIELLKVFFENQSFNLKETPSNYKSCIFYKDKGIELDIKYILNHYNQKIKLAGKIGHFNTKIGLATEFKIADEYQQDYIEKNSAVICVLGSNGLLY